MKSQLKTFAAARCVGRWPCERLEPRWLLAATLVRDINSNAAWGAQSELTAVGANMFFRANDGATGSELWKSDGTTAGTLQVKDIVVGSGSSSPTELTAVGNLLYFVANDGASGAELWKSDGTSSGTMRVKDIASGATSSNPTNLTAFGGSLYFTANNGVLGYELWKSDGTDAGTTMVKDIRVGGGSSAPANLTVANNLLYFTATDGVKGTELWRSDGSSAGTLLVKDIVVGSLSSNPANFTAVGTVLYFTASDASGEELWKSDTTGTALVKDIAVGAISSTPSNLLAVGNTLFFTANDAVHGNELWTSNGLAAGTVLVKDIRVGSSDGVAPANAYYGHLATINGQVLFSANDGTAGAELWTSDGTAANTKLLKDISAGSTSSGPFYFTPVNGKLYFAATDSSAGTELFRTDGSAAGTNRVQDVMSGSGSSFPTSLTNFGGVLNWVADDGSHGRELWRITTAPTPESHVFYNNSKFDGNNSAASAADDAAIATDKQPLLPGQTATFANYTSYTRGINGVMIDVTGLAHTPTAADFTFRVGNDNTPSAWPLAAAPTSVSVRTGAGAGGADRITIIWPDGVIKQQWLQVTLKTSAVTGLVSPYEFYFGNTIGETNDTPGKAEITATDEIGARSHLKSFLTPAALTDLYDFNRDGFVNAADQIAARGNVRILNNALTLIAPPAGLTETLVATPAPMARMISSSSALATVHRDELAIASQIAHEEYHNGHSSGVRHFTTRRDNHYVFGQAFTCWRCSTCIIVCALHAPRRHALGANLGRNQS